VLPSNTTFTVLDPSDRPVTSRASVAEYVEGTTWGPGSRLDASFDWDQHCPESAGCTGGVATRGRYRVDVTWSTGMADYGPASATFDLT
jgi:hypothetical protein